MASGRRPRKPKDVRIGLQSRVMLRQKQHTPASLQIQSCPAYHLIIEQAEPRAHGAGPL